MPAEELDDGFHRMPDGSLVRLEAISFGRIHRVPRERLRPPFRYEDSLAAGRLGFKIPDVSSDIVPHPPAIDMYFTYRPTILFTVYRELLQNFRGVSLQAFGVDPTGEEYPLLWRRDPKMVRIEWNMLIDNRSEELGGLYSVYGPRLHNVLVSWEFPMPPSLRPIVEVRLYLGLLPGQQYTTLKLPNSREWRQKSENAELKYFGEQKNFRI